MANLRLPERTPQSSSADCTLIGENNYTRKRRRPQERGEERDEGEERSKKKASAVVIVQ